MALKRKQILKLLLIDGIARRWRGAVFSFGQMALRSARARGRAGFFFELVLALVARGSFFSCGQMALRSARARGIAGFFFELVLAPVARGRFFLLVKRLALRAGQR